MSRSSISGIWTKKRSKWKNTKSKKMRARKKNKTKKKSLLMYLLRESKSIMNIDSAVSDSKKKCRLRSNR